MSLIALDFPLPIILFMARLADLKYYRRSSTRGHVNTLCVCVLIGTLVLDQLSGATNMQFRPHPNLLPIQLVLLVGEHTTKGMTGRDLQNSSRLKKLHIIESNI